MCPALAGAAQEARGDPRAYRAALRPRDVGCLLRGTQDPTTRLPPRGRFRHARKADREDTHTSGGGSPAGGTRSRDRLWGHELHSRGSARGRETADQTCPRRGRTALLRPHDARGDQQGCRRPPLGPPLLPDGNGGGEPPEGGDHPRRPPRRGHDGRRAGGAPRARVPALEGPRALRPRSAGVPRPHPAPARKRRSQGGPRGDPRRPRGKRRAHPLPRPSPDEEDAPGVRHPRPSPSRHRRHGTPRLPRHDTRDGERKKGPDRLRRRAEGGLPPRRAVHHAPRDDRVGGDPRGRLERPRRLESREDTGRDRELFAREGEDMALRDAGCEREDRGGGEKIQLDPQV